MACDNFSAVSSLIKNGANLSISDKQNQSVLTLLWANSLQKDPLYLSKPQLALFISTSLFWIFSAVIDKWDLSSCPSLRHLMNASCFTSQIVSILSELEVYSEYIEPATSFLLSGVINACYFFSKSEDNSFMGMTMVLIQRAVVTYQIACCAFHGLKSCWNQIAHRNFEATRNFLVHSTSAANSLYDLYSVFRFSQEIAKVS